MLLKTGFVLDIYYKTNIEIGLNKINIEILNFKVEL